MIPFLKQVASAYYDRGIIEHTCFIFPNRRSEVFFIKHLSDLVAEKSSGGKSMPPLTVPPTCTVNDFIYRLYGIAPTDRIALLLELHKVYSELYPGAEPLDEFIFWGDIIIGDFNDVDKYMADPVQLFTNISDLKSIQDSYSYLTERQRKAIEAFVGHFSENGRLTVDLDSDNPKVKERFLQIWNILSALYAKYRHGLSAKRMAYEGMVYRSVAEHFLKEPPEELLAKEFPYADKFVFVGLNALNECEKTVLRQMRKASLAEFCWDYSGRLIRDKHNKSSFFMEENVKEFPQSVHLDEEDLPVPSIRVVSVPSAVGQVKQLPRIFREIADEYAGGDLSKVGILSGKEAVTGADCAVVLPDENLLMPVLNTIPPEIRSINVTMGYPMTSGAFFLFMNLVMEVQMNLRRKGGEWYFYHKPVRALFSDSIFRMAAGEEGRRTIARIKEASELYIPAEELDAGGVFSAVFRPVVTDKTAATEESSSALALYLTEVIRAVVPGLRNSGADRVELEFAAEFARTVSALRKTGLPVRPRTWFGILRQILSPVTVPFKGEPLQGLQIMGPLETRALDFTNIVVLSANEGVFPRRSVSSSFIPPELRRGFGLPSYEYQDAVWAYYFYRMISRASNVWLLTDSRTEGMKSGEESRYIRQLQYHFEISLDRRVVQAALAETRIPEEIPKTEDDIRIIKDLAYSATSLQDYLECPARFYYGRIRKLGKEDEVAEELDAGLFGTVYHELMRSLYLGEDAMASSLPASEWERQAPDGSSLQEISSAYIMSWMKRPEAIREKTRHLIMRELHAIEVAGKNLVTMDVIVRYVLETLRTDLKLLQSSGRDSFRVPGLEKHYETDFRGFRIRGVVDRIDTLAEEGLRIVDYKTGKVDKKRDLAVLTDNADKIAEAVFHSETKQKRPKIALQLYIYDKFLKSDPEFSGNALSNCIYSVSGLFSGLPENYPVSDDFISEMDVRLEALFNELTDISVPFRLTGDTEACGYCDFKNICGR